jgi:hypothetical protein
LCNFIFADILGHELKHFDQHKENWITFAGVLHALEAPKTDDTNAK